MDMRGARFDASELESLDAQGKRTRVEGFGGKAKERPSLPVNFEDSPEIRRRFGENAFRAWDKPRPMGWSHAGCSYKAAFWREDKGSPSPVLVAPVGILPETCRLLIHTGAFKGNEAIPCRFKKNFSLFNHMRLLFLKTRLVLRFILGLAGYGPRKESARGFLLPANITQDLTFLDGLHPFWAGAV